MFGGASCVLPDGGYKQGQWDTDTDLGWESISRRSLCLCFKCEPFVFCAALHFVACFIVICQGKILIGYDVIAVVLKDTVAFIFHFSTSSYTG